MMETEQFSEDENTEKQSQLEQPPAAGPDRSPRFQGEGRRQR